MKNETENELIKELKRIKLFLKNNKILILIIFILTLIFMNYMYDIKNKNNILKGGVLGETICDTAEIVHPLKIVGCYLFGYSILKNLTDKNKDKTPNKWFIYPVWLFRAFIFRPIYGAFMILVVLFAITGSFIFPFVLFGILLYYIIKTLMSKYSNTKINKNNSNKNKNNNNNI